MGGKALPEVQPVRVAVHWSLLALEAPAEVWYASFAARNLGSVLMAVWSGVVCPVATRSGLGLAAAVVMGT